MSEPGVNRNSSKEAKRDAAEAVFEALSNFFFDEVNLLNSPDTAVSSAAGSPNTSTTVFTTGIRVPDTARGLYMRPDKKSRLRTMFYVNEGATSMEGYILSPAVYPSQVGISGGISSMSVLSSYVGIKILEGAVHLVSYFSGRERTILTDFRITDSTTHVLDIIYTITSALIIIDGKRLGRISCNLLETIDSPETFFPIVAPVRSTNGTGVRMSIEGYQFLQDR